MQATPAMEKTKFDAGLSHSADSAGVFANGKGGRA